MIHVAEVVAPLTMNEGALCPWTEEGPNEAGESQSAWTEPHFGRQTPEHGLNCKGPLI